MGYWRLRDLSPRPIRLGTRSGVGFSFRCPNAGSEHVTRFARNHRLWVWFGWPDDAGEPNWEESSHHAWHQGCIEELANFSCYSATAEDRMLEFPGHWRGYFVDGVAYGTLL